MYHPLLQNLLNAEDLIKLHFFHTNVNVIRRRLAAHEAVKACVQGWNSKDIKEDDVDAVLTGLLQTYQPGRLFAYEYAMCALIFLASETKGLYMEELLRECAALPSREMPLTFELLRSLGNV